MASLNSANQRSLYVQDSTSRLPLLVRSQETNAIKKKSKKESAHIKIYKNLYILNRSQNTKMSLQFPLI